MQLAIFVSKDGFRYSTVFSSTLEHGLIMLGIRHWHFQKYVVDEFENKKVRMMNSIFHVKENF